MEIKAFSDDVGGLNSIHYCASGKEKSLTWDGLPTSQESIIICIYTTVKPENETNNLYCNKGNRWHLEKY